MAVTVMHGSIEGDLGEIKCKGIDWIHITQDRGPL